MTINVRTDKKESVVCGRKGKTKIKQALCGARRDCWGLLLQERSDEEEEKRWVI